LEHLYITLAGLPGVAQAFTTVQPGPRPRSTPTILIDFILLISISPISILPTNQHGESAFSNQHYTHHNQQISESANQHFTRVLKLDPSGRVISNQLENDISTRFIHVNHCETNVHI